MLNAGLTSYGKLSARICLSGGTNIWVITGSPTRACTSTASEEYRVDVRGRADCCVLLSRLVVRGNRFMIFDHFDECTLLWVSTSSSCLYWISSLFETTCGTSAIDHNLPPLGRTVWSFYEDHIGYFMTCIYEQRIEDLVATRLRIFCQ
jgi:hypothetical protein